MNPRSQAPWCGRRVVLASAVLLTVVLAACSSSDASTDGATDAADEPTTEEAADATTTSTVDPSTVPPGGEGWTANARAHDAEIGQSFGYDCPPMGTPQEVWGAGYYASPSSVCTAAVQVGLISFVEGGQVTIEMVDGRESYAAATANAVTSVAAGSSAASFIFPSAPEGGLGDIPRQIAWTETPESQGAVVGEKRTVSCRSSGTVQQVWGFGTYTANSSICSAALQQGRITQGAGGRVHYSVRPGLDSYESGNRNGVPSDSFGAYPLSFVIEPT